MATKEERDKAFKAFKKRLKIYQAVASGSSAPASHLSREKFTIVGVEPPPGFPPEVWDELVEKGKLKKGRGNTYELNRPS
jgi:hypothetical protein